MRDATAKSCPILNFAGVNKKNTIRDGDSPVDMFYTVAMVLRGLWGLRGLLELFPG